LEKNVRGEVIDEADLFDKGDGGDGDEDIVEQFGIETVLPVSKLKKTAVDVPEGFTHFSLLPVDYNRGGSDIVIAFFTKEGKKYYGDKLTGDY
jgi:hypothetical protein